MIPLAVIIVLSILLLISIVLNIFFPIYYSNKKKATDKLFSIEKKSDTDLENTTEMHPLNITN